MLGAPFVLLHEPPSAATGAYRSSTPPLFFRLPAQIPRILRWRGTDSYPTTEIKIKISRGDDCHHELGFTFCYVSKQEATGGSENRRNISNTDEYRKTRNIAIFATFFVTDRVRTAYLMCIYHTMQSQLYQCAVSMLYKFTVRF